MKVVKELGVVSFFVLMVSMVTWPQVVYPSSATGEHIDALFSAWRLAWVAHQLLGAPAHLFDAGIFYPESRTLAYSDALLLPGALSAPLLWSGVPVVAVYNLVLLGSYLTAAYCMYALVREWTGDRIAGLLAGIGFAFSTHQLEHFERLELQTTCWIPLTLMYAQRGVVSGSWSDWLRSGVCIAGQVLSGIYHGVFLLVCWPIFVAASLRQWTVRSLAQPVVALQIGLVVLGLYSIPYLHNRDRLGERRQEEVRALSAELDDFLAVHPQNVLYGRLLSAFGVGERFLFPGAVVIVFCAIGMVSHGKRREKLALMASGLVAFAVCLGLNGPLYPLLYEWLSPFRGLRAPARAVVLLNVSIMVLAGFGIAWFRSRSRSAAFRVAASTVLILLASSEYLARPQLRTVNVPTEDYRALRNAEQAVVFEWPVTTPDRLDINNDVVFMLYSTAHWKPLVNGYSGFYPESYVELLETMKTFPSADALTYLRKRGVTHVVLHRWPGWEDAFERATATLALEEAVAVEFRNASGDLIVFRLK